LRAVAPHLPFYGSVRRTPVIALPPASSYSRAFFTACNKAQAAADYLRGLALREQQPARAA
jgi:hypothetical protein